GPDLDRPAAGRGRGTPSPRAVAARGGAPPRAQRAEDPPRGARGDGGPAAQPLPPCLSHHLRSLSPGPRPDAPASPPVRDGAATLPQHPGTVHRARPRSRVETGSLPTSRWGLRLRPVLGAAGASGAPL